MSSRKKQWGKSLYPLNEKTKIAGSMPPAYINATRLANKRTEEANAEERMRLLLAGEEIPKYVKVSKVNSRFPAVPGTRYDLVALPLTVSRRKSHDDYIDAVSYFFRYQPR